MNSVLTLLLRYCGVAVKCQVGCSPRQPDLEGGSPAHSKALELQGLTLSGL